MKTILKKSTLKIIGKIILIGFLFSAQGFIRPAFAQSQLIRMVPTPHMQAAQLIRENKKNEALAFINDYLKNNPNDPQMLFWKAKILNDSKLANEREESYQLYLSLSDNYPELPEPHNNLGVIFAAQGDYSKAIDYFKLALKANPSYSTASENLADVYLLEAFDFYSRAVEDDPSNKTAKQKFENLKSEINNLIKFGIPPTIKSTSKPTP